MRIEEKISEYLQEKINIKKNKEGRRFIKFKGSSSHKVETWTKNDFKKINEKSQEFTGEECAHLIFDNGPGKLPSDKAFHKEHKFKGSDGNTYVVAAKDTENPRGPSYIIIEAKNQ